MNLGHINVPGFYYIAGAVLFRKKHDRTKITVNRTKKCFHHTKKHVNRTKNLPNRTKMIFDPIFVRLRKTFTNKQRPAEISRSFPFIQFLILLKPFALAFFPLHQTFRTAHSFPSLLHELSPTPGVSCTPFLLPRSPFAQ